MGETDYKEEDGLGISRFEEREYEPRVVEVELEAYRQELASYLEQLEEDCYGELAGAAGKEEALEEGYRVRKEYEDLLEDSDDSKED